MQQLARIRESSQDKPFDLLIIGGAPAALTGPTCYCGFYAQGVSSPCMGCKTAQANICNPLRLAWPQVARRELGVLQMLPPGASRTEGPTLVTIELLFALLFRMPYRCGCVLKPGRQLCLIRSTIGCIFCISCIPEV